MTIIVIVATPTAVPAQPTAVSVFVLSGVAVSVATLPVLERGQSGGTVRLPHGIAVRLEERPTDIARAEPFRPTPTDLNILDHGASIHAHPDRTGGIRALKRCGQANGTIRREHRTDALAQLGRVAPRIQTRQSHALEARL